jgi:outer membrane receptor protein involved in Fe transport
VQDPNLGVLTLAGGNPQLSPERGTSFDAGVDLHWEGTLRVKASIDFFRTTLEGFISEAANDTLLEQCVDETIAAACTHIERNADGTIRRIVATEQNFGRIVVRGTDFSVNLAAVAPLGRLQIGGSWRRILRAGTKSLSRAACQCMTPARSMRIRCRHFHTGVRLDM